MALDVWGCPACHIIATDTRKKHLEENQSTQPLIGWLLVYADLDLRSSIRATEACGPAARAGFSKRPQERSEPRVDESDGRARP